MASQQNTFATALCLCGSVELELIGTSIISVVCYCDDCQVGSEQIEALPNAKPILDSYDGTASSPPADRGATQEHLTNADAGDLKVGWLSHANQGVD